MNDNQSDVADWMLLKLANHKGKFALGIPTPPSVAEPFERGIDEEWFTLVDMTPLAAAHGTILIGSTNGGDGIFKIFRLTKKGWRHHAELKKKFGDVLRSNDGEGKEATEAGEPAQD